MQYVDKLWIFCRAFVLVKHALFIDKLDIVTNLYNHKIFFFSLDIKAFGNFWLKLFNHWFCLSVCFVQSNTCVCLEGLPLQGSRRSSDCNLPCDEEYSAETKIKYLYDCGGNATFTLFKSGIFILKYWSIWNIYYTIIALLRSKLWFSYPRSTILTEPGAQGEHCTSKVA